MRRARIDGWYTLVHVCQRWRYVVLGSPRRLNLHLLCTTTDRTQVRTLDIWPPLPLVIGWFSYPGPSSKHKVSDIIAALGHKDRIVVISLLDVPPGIWQELVGSMQESLPALTNLQLSSENSWMPYSSRVMDPLPTSFLGGSAPLLQYLDLNRVPYPALPKLISSARDLVKLQVSNLTNKGYISSEDMAACLSLLTKLTIFVLEFESDWYPPVRQVTHRSSRQEWVVLHSLAAFHYKGPTKYLEDLVARIDAPRLSEVEVTFVRAIAAADISEFSQFIGQADNFPLLNQADIFISDTADPNVTLCLSIDGGFSVTYELTIPCTDWSLLPSTLARVCVHSTRGSLSSSLPLSALENLAVRGFRATWPRWKNCWLEFLHAFTAVKNLHLSEDVKPHLLPLLKDVTGERIMEVLPALQNLFLNKYQPPPKHVQKALQEFTTVRRLADRPVAVSKWNRRQWP